jgi:hypothetical protein
MLKGFENVHSDKSCKKYLFEVGERTADPIR